MKKIISLIIIAALAVSLMASCAERPQSDTGPAGQPSSQIPAGSDTEPEDGSATEPVAGEPTEAYTSEDQPGTEPETDAPTSEEAVTDAPTAEEQTTEAPSPVPAADALKSFDDFDLKLMDFIEQGESGNYVISPLSFKYALGMLLAGAGGNTLKQFTDGLGLKSKFSKTENFKINI